MTLIAFQSIPNSTRCVGAVLLALVLPACKESIDCGAEGYEKVDGVCVPVEEDVDRGSMADSDAGPAGDGCQDEHGTCAQQCVETPSGFRCACDDGYTLAEDGRSCDPVAGGETSGGRATEDDGGADRDGIDDPDDNCAAVPNPGQENHDGDAQGDACDADDDDDGVLDDDDACPRGLALGTDTDGDGCKDDGEDDDDDADGLIDQEDSCPSLPAHEDDDLDGDGCPLNADACPSGGYVGPDRDHDGCLDIEDDAVATPDPPARVVYVDAFARPAAEPDGQSWETAFHFLQDGIRAANRMRETGRGTSSLQSVEVWIAEGIYYPDESSGSDITDNDPSVSFQPATGVRLIGGFRRDGKRWVRDAFDDTILSGDIDQDDEQPFLSAFDQRGSNTCGVVGNWNYKETLFLSGLVVQSGNGDACENGLVPGGIVNQGLTVLQRVRVRGNGGSVGAAVLHELIAVDTIWEGNHAPPLDPSAATCVASRIRAHNLVVRATLGYGIGVHDSAAIVNSTFSGNLGVGFGADGKVEILQTSFVGHDFVENSPVENALLLVALGSPSRLANIVIVSNSAGLNQDADGGALPVYNHVLIQDMAESPPNVLRSYDVSGGDMFVAPVDYMDAPTAGGDLHLHGKPFNPAVDTGTTEAPACPDGFSRMALLDGTPICQDGKLAVDADGNPRLSGEAVDLGAYELVQ